MSGSKPLSRPLKQTEAQRRAEREKRRTANERDWASKCLEKLGKGDVLKTLEEQKYTYTPFEMRLLLDPTETSMALEAHTIRIQRVFDATRNVMIVLPLMLTWLSLSLAGAAYELSLHMHPALGTQPLLQQWQEGFPTIQSVHFWRWNVPLVVHHDHWFTFATFALSDAVLLAIVLILTMLGQYLESRAFRRGSRLFNFLENFHYSLNLGTLAGRMTKDPGEEDLPPWLRELQSRLGQLGEVIQSMNVALESSLNSYTTAIESQEKAVKDLVEDTTNIHDAVTRLDKFYQEGVEAQRAFREHIPIMTRQVSSMAENEQKSTTAMLAMYEMLRTTMFAMADAVGHVKQAEEVVRKWEGRPPRFGRSSAEGPRSYWQPSPPRVANPPRPAQSRNVQGSWPQQPPAPTYEQERRAPQPLGPQDPSVLQRDPDGIWPSEGDPQISSGYTPGPTQKSQPIGQRVRGWLSSVRHRR